MATCESKCHLGHLAAVDFEYVQQCCISSGVFLQKFQWFHVILLLDSYILWCSGSPHLLIHSDGCEDKRLPMTFRPFTIRMPLKPDEVLRPMRS